MRLFQQSKIGRENVGLSARHFRREGFSGPTKYFKLHIKEQKGVILARICAGELTGGPFDLPEIYFTGTIKDGLTSFTCYGSYVNKAFNVSDMKEIDFANEFIKNYGIPHLETIENGWEYKDDSGWSIKIFPSKTFEVKKIISKSERIFD